MNLNYKRNMSIYLDYKQGLNTLKLSEKYGITPSYTSTIVKRIESEKDTLLSIWEIDNQLKRKTVIRLPLQSYRTLLTLIKVNLIFIDELVELASDYINEDRDSLTKAPDKIGFKKMEDIIQALDRYREKEKNITN